MSVIFDLMSIFINGLLVLWPPTATSIIITTHTREQSAIFITIRSIEFVSSEDRVAWFTLISLGPQMKSVHPDGEFQLPERAARPPVNQSEIIICLFGVKTSKISLLKGLTFSYRSESSLWLWLARPSWWASDIILSDFRSRSMGEFLSSRHNFPQNFLIKRSWKISATLWKCRKLCGKIPIFRFMKSIPTL